MCGSLFLKLPFDCLVPWSCLFASQMSVSMSNPLASRTACSARDVTELRAVTSFNKAPRLQRRGMARKRVGCNLEVLIISQLSING